MLKTNSLMQAISFVRIQERRSQGVWSIKLLIEYLSLVLEGESKDREREALVSTQVTSGRSLATTSSTIPLTSSESFSTKTTYLFEEHIINY